jgi:hypothetical protein
MQQLELPLMIGAGFGVLGAAMAYLITYEEYSHHFVDRRQARLMSLRTSVVSFFALLIISLAAIWVLLGTIKTS